LHDERSPVLSRSFTVPDGYSWYSGAGEDEEMLVQITEGGIHCLTVWKAEAASLMEEGNYSVTVALGATGVEELPSAALRPGITSIYPNPFNPSTRIIYELSVPGPARLVIYDARGRQIRTLVAETLPAGRHELVWRGRDDRGQAVASGLYIVRMEADGVNDVRKLIMLQ